MKSNLISIAAVLAAAVAMAQPAGYIVTDLGPAGAFPGQPFSIGHHDYVAGTLVFTNGSAHSIVWYKDVPFDISTPGMGGSNSIAFNINLKGQVVGEAETSTPDPHQEDFCGFKALGLKSNGGICAPIIWENGVMTKLETLGGNNGIAFAINNRDQAVGLAETAIPDATCPQPLSFQFKPVLWGIGQVQALPTFPGDSVGVAHYINDHGQAAGASGNCVPFDPNVSLNLQPLHALFWENGVATDMGNLGGSGHFGGNIAIAINNLGEAVGNSDLAGDTTFHAFLWSKAKGMQDLGVLPGDVASVSVAINDNSQVTGLSLDADGNPGAFLWEKGVMYDLNALVPSDSPFYLLLACSVSKSGEIIGLAVDKLTGEAHSYLATPRPTAIGSENAPAAVHRTILSENARQAVRKLRLGRSGAFNR